MPKPNDKIAEQLVILYKKSIERLQKILIGLDASDIKNRRHYIAILKQIEDEFREIDNHAAAWIKDNVSKSYQTGSAEGLRQLRELGITPTMTLFSKPHQQMMKHVAEGFYYDFHKIVDQNKNSLITFIRRAHVGEAQQSEILKAVGRGGIEGRVTKDVTADILKALQTSLIDNRIVAGSKSYKASTYAEMLARTHLRVAFTRGTTMRLSEHGVDLVQVSAHGTVCPNCEEFENKVFSISGSSDVYPPLDLLPNGGTPFHPYCLHVLSGFIEALKDKSEIKEAQWIDVKDAKVSRIDLDVLHKWRKLAA